jgi:hypothetical protein
VSFAENIGMEAYFVQRSRADERAGRDGSRITYWVKDLTAQVVRNTAKPDQVRAFIDVDYYMDMPSELADDFAPTIIYAFQPEVAARDDGEYSFTFNARNQVVYSLSGGATYTHEVWNYGSDNFIMTRKVFGIPYQVATFAVDRRRVSQDRELILLSPMRRWSGPKALLAYFIKGSRLTRLKPVQGDFLRLKVQTETGLQVSTGQVGRYVCGTLPANFDDALAVTATTSTVKLSLPSVVKYFSDDMQRQERNARASAVLLYHRCQANKVPLSEAMVFPAKHAVRSFDFGVNSFDPEAKETLVAFMSPLVHGAFAPSVTKANEEACVRGRVTQFARRPGELKMTEFLDRAMREFVELFIPQHLAHSFEPVTIDDVYERQPRPSQRTTLDRSLIEEAEPLIKMFIKREAYQNVKEPRPISTINGPDKREYSRYIYPLAEHLKTTDWYAFGHPPAIIAQRVGEVLKDAHTAANSDFSRFDGRVSELLRDLERRILLRAYPSMYAQEVSDLHSSQYCQPAIGKLGTKYNTGFARASGSPETAAFNSLANAFTTFLTFRMTRENGAFLTPEESWARLGVYGGDDGLTADIDPEKYTKASDMLGLKLEVDIVGRGEFGITFLARMYGPNVWFGDCNSCCDIYRQVSKLHTTVRLPPNVTATDKLLEKARSYLLTDANTPIIGPFAKAVLKAAQAELLIPPGELFMTTRTQGMRAWNSELAPDKQYPNEDGGWMEEYASNSMADFDFDRLAAFLATEPSIEQLLLPPLCAEPREPEPKAPVVVDGEVVEPDGYGVLPTKRQDTRRGRGTRGAQGGANGNATARSRGGRPPQEKGGRRNAPAAGNTGNRGARQAKADAPRGTENPKGARGRPPTGGKPQGRGKERANTPRPPRGAARKKPRAEPAKQPATAVTTTAGAGSAAGAPTSR